MSTQDSIKKDDHTPTDKGMLFQKKNYQLMLIGIGLIVLGFVAMSGGSMPNPETWDESLIYSPRRTILAPILILAGLGMQVYAIFKK